MGSAADGPGGQIAIARPSPDEFVQLPYGPWDSRPETLPLDVDECATALFLANGNVKGAADLLYP
jgi:hypothetical protein